MPRQVRISLPSNETGQTLKELKGIHGVVGLRVQRGASISPPGDVIEVDVINRELSALLRLLDSKNIGRSPDSSLSSSLPASLVSPSSIDDIASDSSESSWEEIELTLPRQHGSSGRGKVRSR